MTKSSSKVDKPVTPTSIFIGMGLDMSWRLALGVLVPIVGGVYIDKWLKTSPLFLIIGFVVAIVGTVLIIRRTVNLANTHPVFNPPKEGDK